MRADKGHSGVSLAVFVLLGVFAFTAVMTVLLCTQIYRRTVDDVAENADRRIIDSYLSDALRSGDRAGAIEIASVQGVDVLRIGSEDGWAKCIYCKDGMLLEQLYDEDVQGMELDYGEAVCKLSAFEPKWDGQIMALKVTDAKGQTWTLHEALMCNQGEVLQ